MIVRHSEIRLQDLLARFPVVALLGRRQVGKTTLGLALGEKAAVKSVYFDLERLPVGALVKAWEEAQ